MDQLLFTDGTAWEAAPPPRGLRTAALELVHSLVAIQVEQPWPLVSVVICCQMTCWPT